MRLGLAWLGLCPCLPVPPCKPFTCLAWLWQVVTPPGRRVWREVRLGDTLRDLPPIANEELRQERKYEVQYLLVATS